MAATRLVIPDADTFDEMVENGDYRLAQAIVEGILTQLPTDADFIDAVEIYVEEEDNIYDLAVEGN